MKCPICGSNMVINSKGELVCPICNRQKKKVVVVRNRFNDLVYFRVVSSTGVIVDDYLLEEEIKDLVRKGVEVIIK